MAVVMTDTWPHDRLTMPCIQVISYMAASSSKRLTKRKSSSLPIASHLCLCHNGLTDSAAILTAQPLRSFAVRDARKRHQVVHNTHTHPQEHANSIRTAHTHTHTHTHTQTQTYIHTHSHARNSHVTRTHMYTHTVTRNTLRTCRLMHTLEVMDSEMTALEARVVNASAAIEASRAEGDRIARMVRDAQRGSWLCCLSAS